MSRLAVPPYPLLDSGADFVRPCKMLTTGYNTPAHFFSKHSRTGECQTGQRSDKVVLHQNLQTLHRHISTWTIGCSAPSPLQPIDSLHQCLLPTSASSFHGSKTSGKQVCIEINAEQQWSSFSGKRICVGSNDERQQRISLSIHEFGDLVAAPIPLLGTQNIVSWLKVI